jgi:ankyrin repeat protein
MSQLAEPIPLDPIKQFFSHAGSGLIEEIRSMIDAGMPIDQRQDSTGMTILHIAAKNRDVPLMDFLIDRGLPIDVLDAYGNTPLHLAAYLNAHLSCSHLLDRGASLTSINNAGHTPLLKCAYTPIGSLHDSSQALEVLLNAGANVFDRALRTECSVLHRLDQENMFRLLLDRGADLEARDIVGRTPLHEISAYTRNLKPIFQMMIERGVDLDARDQEGNTPLHVAAKRGRGSICMLLLDAGANARLENKSGETAFDCALAHQQDPIWSHTILLFIAHGGKSSRIALSDEWSTIEAVEAAVQLGLTPLVLDIIEKESISEGFQSLIDLATSYQKNETAAAIQSVAASLEIEKISRHSITAGTLHP